MTQLDKIKQILEEKGEIDNYWAWETRLTNRLGMHIHLLRQQGMKIEGATGKKLGKPRAEHKNYYYKLVKTNEKNK